MCARDCRISSRFDHGQGEGRNEASHLVLPPRDHEPRNGGDGSTDQADDDDVEE